MKRNRVTKKEKITEKAMDLLKSNPDGIRYTELAEMINKELTEVSPKTIYSAIWNLDKRLPNEVYKPARGIFRYIASKTEELNEEEEAQRIYPEIEEKDFYLPFANWLVYESEECTKAIPLGGNLFRDKWGTPDVIGKREPRRSDIVKAPTEIVSAEIKTNSKDIITAFGQACSYKLFSHKSYIVIPKSSSQEDISRLDALCLIFGIGLILFDSSNPNDPKYEIRVRPLKHEPDMFYVNKHMKLIEKELFAD